MHTHQADVSSLLFALCYPPFPCLITFILSPHRFSHRSVTMLYQPWNKIAIFLAISFCLICCVDSDGSTTPQPSTTVKPSGPTPMPIGYPDGNGPTTTTPPPTPNPTSMTTESVTDDYELAKKRVGEFVETYGKK